MVIHSTKQKTDKQIAAIDAENVQLKQLVRALKSENLNLQKEIGKIKAKHITESIKLELLRQLKLNFLKFILLAPKNPNLP